MHAQDPYPWPRSGRRAVRYGELWPGVVGTVPTLPPRCHPTSWIRRSRCRGGQSSGCRTRAMLAADRGSVSFVGYPLSLAMFGENSARLYTCAARPRSTGRRGRSRRSLHWWGSRAPAPSPTRTAVQRTAHPLLSCLSVSTRFLGALNRLRMLIRPDRHLHARPAQGGEALRGRGARAVPGAHLAVGGARLAFVVSSDRRTCPILSQKLPPA